METLTNPVCPQCSSNRIWKDGFRHTRSNEAVQRFLCRNCGYRFSEPSQKLDIVSKQIESFHSSLKLHDRRVASVNLPIEEATDNRSFMFTKDFGVHNLTKLGKGLNILPSKLSNCQICASNEEAKNLAATEIEKQTVAGNLQNNEVKGLIIKYMAYLEKEGYTTKSSYLKLIKRLAKIGANLLDPEAVKTVIAKQSWKHGTKMLAIYAYDAFAKMEKITWQPPKYTQEEALPFVPEEKELDQLIASCQSRRMAAFLQTLKETYADPEEILRLRWIDISNNVLTINNPVKGHLPGQNEVSNKLLAMLNMLPKNSERIFPTNYSTIYTCFDNVRKRAARLLQNPRLLKVSFKSFRHWGGSMIAHYTNGNVLTVKKLLRHKRVESTMKYISMIHFKDDEFEVTTATTVEEAKQILSAGFDYVTAKDGIMLFRRPKRFGGLNAKCMV